MTTPEIVRPPEPSAPPAVPAPSTAHARPRKEPWPSRAVVPFLVLLQAVLSLRLSNAPSDDEALYIQAGRELLANWRTGESVVDFGTFFSGAPAAYPVLAGLLDQVGGLGLVRGFSLACVVVTMLCVRATTRHLFGPRAGDLAGFSFAVTGPVVFLGALATFDALCLMLLALALWLGIARTSDRSAGLAGLALAAATVVKYTGLAFVPVILALVLLGGTRGPDRHQLRRVLTAAAVAAGTLGVLYLLWGDRVRDGILYTTAGREPLSPAPASLLVQYAVQDIGLLTVLALCGGLFVVRSPRWTLFLLAMFAGASGLLLSQLHLGEAMSFEKHTAYSALFLAPLAGRALAELARPTVPAVLLAAVMSLLLVSGVVRSYAMHHQWPEVSRVAEQVTALVAEDPRAGQYFSTQASQMRYYTYDEFPQARWVAHYSIYDSDPAAVRQLVEDRTFELIVWRSGSTGNPREDAILDVFREAALDSPHYDLATEPLPVEGRPGQEWYILQLKH